MLKALGFLNANSALITENTEGEHYCELDCQNTPENSKYFKKGVIISVTGEHGGAFRIGAPIKTNRKLKAKCYSLFYDTDNYIISSLPLINVTVSEALEAIKNSCDREVPFQFYTDFPDDVEISLNFKNITLKEALMQLKEEVAGYYAETGLNITLYQSLGKNSGTVLRYAENIKGITVSENWDNVCTKLKAMTDYNDTIYEKWYESETQYNSIYAKIIEFDLTPFIDIPGGLQLPPPTPEVILSKLDEQANKYLAEHSKPIINYNIEAHIKTAIHIWDICKVIYPKLSINSELQVIETKWDGVSQRYESAQFGTLLPSITGLYSRLGGMEE